MTILRAFLATLLIWQVCARKQRGCCQDYSVIPPQQSSSSSDSDLSGKSLDESLFSVPDFLDPNPDIFVNQKSEKVTPDSTPYQNPYGLPQVTRQSVPGNLKTALEPDYPRGTVFPNYEQDYRVDTGYLQKYFDSSYRPGQDYYRNATINLQDEKVYLNIDEQTVQKFVLLAGQITEAQDRLEASLRSTGVLIDRRELEEQYWWTTPVNDKTFLRNQYSNSMEVFYELLKDYVEIKSHQTPYFNFNANISSLCKPVSDNNYPQNYCIPTNEYYFNGKCNRQSQPTVGAIPTGLFHMAGPSCSPANSRRPSPRTVSLQLAAARAGEIARTPYKGQAPSVFSLLTFQLLMHDSTGQRFRAPKFGGSGLRGCTTDYSRLDSSLLHPSLDPIEISSDDPFYSAFNVSCLEFIKDQRFNPYCEVKDASSLLISSPVIDLSQIYPNAYQDIFSFIDRNGDFKTDSFGIPKLPDPRSDQTSYLKASHIAFVYLHKEISKEIKRLNPILNDETIFRKSRKITIWLTQYILYNLLLPIYLGEEYTQKQGISTLSDCYNPNLEPKTLAEFACAASRYAHAFLPNQGYFLYPDYSIRRKVDLKTNYGGPDILKTHYSSCVRGAMWARIQLEGYPTQAQNELFAGSEPFGTDLYALDVKRGRDCCLKPYVHYLKMFDNVNIQSFADLERYIPRKSVKILSQKYEKPEDVDFYAGASMEIKPKGSRFGPTFRRVIGEQYWRLKSGDSKFFTHVLSQDLIEELRRFNFSFCLCHIFGWNYINKDVFLAVSDQNPIVECPKGSFSQLCLDVAKFINL